MRNAQISPRTFVLCTLSLCTLSLSAQQIAYFMPKTEVVLDVTYEEVVEQRGPFYQYSERYLGTTDVVTADKTTCILTDIDIQTRGIADHSTQYFFSPEQAGINSFTLTKSGLIKDINNAKYEGQMYDVRNACTKDEERKMKNDRAQIVENVSERSIAPWSEDVLLATSTIKMADGTAKQIYRLRETRINLLAGEVDKAPADGDAMRQVLAELDKQERALTSLFIGQKQRNKKHIRITIALDNILSSDTENSGERLRTFKETEIIAFRFSPVNGVVESTDLSGDPVYLTISDIYRPQQPEAPKKAPELSGIAYCTPGSAKISTRYEGPLMLRTKVEEQETIYLSQLGYTAFFTQDFIKNAPKLLFDTKTGAIKSTK